MMVLKRILAVGLCAALVFALYGCGGGGGGESASKPVGQKPAGGAEAKPEVKTGPPVVKPDMGSATTKAEKAEQRKLAKRKLNNTEWDVLVTKEGSEKSTNDILIFKEMQVHSIKYKKDGYEPSNFSVRVRPTSISWETMQSKPGEGVVFWRGDWQDDVMRGVISEHPDKGEAESFSFVSTVSRRLEEPEEK
jgi:hypothetical protein